MILEEKRVRGKEKQAGEVGMGQVFRRKPVCKEELGVSRERKSRERSSAQQFCRITG